LWVDYDDDIALHPVVTTHPEEQRLMRLASPSPLDNRISYGCINVAADFFQNVVMRTFGATDAVIYILPDSHPIQAFFPQYREGHGTNA
jgi:hypothetical protein